MTVAVVQHAAHAHNQVDSGTNTFSVTLPSPATAGNTLLLLGATSSDAHGRRFMHLSGWTDDERNNGQASHPGGQHATLACRKVAAGGEQTVTITVDSFDGNSTTYDLMTLVLLEISGAFDQYAGPTYGSGASASISAITPTAGVEAILVIGLNLTNAYGITGYPSGYTSLEEIQATGGASYRAYAASKAVNPTSGTYGPVSIALVGGAVDQFDEYHYSFTASTAHGDLAVDAPVSVTVGSNLAINYSFAFFEVLPPVFDASVYGRPVYDAVLINPEVYGEVPLLSVSQVNKDLAVSYVVDADTGQSLVLDYVVRKPAGASLGIDYLVKDLAFKNLALDYVIDELVATQVGADLGIDYIVGTAGGAHKDLAFHYKVTKPTKTTQVGANLAFKYQILHAVPVGKNLQFKYRVIEATHVGKNLAFHYALQTNTKVGANLGFTYAVQKNTVVGRNLGITYAVDTIPPVIVAGRDLSIDDAISVNNLAGSNLGFDFDIGIDVLAGAELTVDADLAIATMAGADLDLDNVIDFKAEVGSDLDFDAVVDLSTPRSDLPFDSVIAQQTPFADLAIDAPIAGTAGSDLGLDYFLGLVVRPKQGGGYWNPTPKVVVTEPVSSDLHINHVILGTITSSFTMSSKIAAIVRTDLAQDHRVRNKVTQLYGMDHQIVDWYDTNEAILLEEIDQDLALTR